MKLSRKKLEILRKEDLVEITLSLQKEIDNWRRANQFAWETVGVRARRDCPRRLVVKKVQ